MTGYYLVYRDKFTINNNHPQESFLWINIRLFRKDEYYRNAIIVVNSYLDFQNPSQDDLETIEDYKFAFIPLNFNLYLHYDNNLDKLWR